jgi:FkbM family methyltransferase
VEGRVIALDPAFENYLKLAQFSHHVKEQNVIPLCLAAWDKPTWLSFDCDKQSGGSNRVGDSGGGCVAATSIDMLARDLSLSRIDLVKLDVEGAEVRALEGAREVIERHRPKLHVSIYHTKNDLVDLPLTLDELLRGYCFYMGHHSYYHTETDLYAVPLAGS